ncbi:MAG: Binding-protein-dependent transport system inner rane component [Bradyrhizobium sp.]|jgi:NitT/TauT family transport system permease protein|nr:Binding-protein-dependent transport system inner rane component [Bradyrhizobium sp.]MEA2866658.1 NitT/TauT family transport system permease protein [Bradyrhizobium sp.]
MIQQNEASNGGASLSFDAVPDDTNIVSAVSGRSFWKRLREHQPAIVDLIAVAVLWQISTYFFSPAIVPPLGDIGRAIWRIFSQWSNLVSLLATSLRVLVALLLAFVLGTALGVTMGLFKGVRTYARPLLHMIQGVPALSWVVFAVIWFAQVEVRIAFILLIGTLPAFALYIDSAVQSVNLDLIHLGQAFRASRTQSLTKIILPAIVPEIMSAWTVNLGNGVRVAVIAELIGSTVGVGFQLLQAQSVFDMAGAVAWTLSLVAVLFIYQGIISFCEGRLLSWRPRSEVA